MRLNTKTPSPTPDRSDADSKGKTCAPKPAAKQRPGWLQQARSGASVASGASVPSVAAAPAALGALAAALCLGYAALNPEPCLYARAWCGAAMVLAPVALRRLQRALPEHEAVLAAAGLAVLASHASAASKDALCMLVLGAGSVHALAIFWRETATQHRCAVTGCLAAALLSTSVLTLALWGGMDPHTTAAVLAAFLALYVASLCLAKL